jgi:DNA-binding transcriptional ArsR family regulator
MADDLDRVFATVAGYFAVLADPTRLKIIHAVCAGEKTVSQIVLETGATQTNVSRHLGVLHRHGMLSRRKNGAQVYYAVADETLIHLCNTVGARIAQAIEERRPLKQQLLKLLPASGKRVQGMSDG